MDKFCVTVTQGSFEKICELANKHKFIELRLDKLNLTNSELAEIVSITQTTIVSCIECKSEQTFIKLIQGIESNANIIDIPYEFLDTSFFIELKKKIDEKSTRPKLIISYHNFEYKDTNKILIDILEKMRNFSPEYYKIAVNCKTIEEVKEFFKLFEVREEFKKLILVPMGQEYSSFRVESVKLGSPFMYCFDEEFIPIPAAPGQLSITDMKHQLS